MVALVKDKVRDFMASNWDDYDKDNDAAVTE